VQIYAIQQQRDNALGGNDTPHLTRRIPHFELTNKTLVQGIAELTHLQADLHLGLEELPRAKITDPRDTSVRFSVILENKTVQEILDALCKRDERYTWSVDQRTINIYPVLMSHDEEYFLNLRIESISLNDIPDPDQALTPLSRLMPMKQIGYMGLGGDNSYPTKWSAAFNDLTVRQFINRIAEHMGNRGFWVYQGSQQERFFTFLKGHALIE
jgi:hypothetical protein